MAEKVQITPMVTPDTRDLLRRTCQEKGCSQGDMVEQALLSFLTPTGDKGKMEKVLEKLTTLEEGLGALIAVLQASVTPPTPPVPDAKVPIATYEQMYGPIDAAAPPGAETPPPQPTPTPPSRLRRWFMREVSA